MMASSNNTLDSMRALGSISSGGVVPAAMQLAQRGAMAGYPAAMLQQQYLSSIPWLLRMQQARASFSRYSLAAAYVDASGYSAPRDTMDFVW